jgi:predicted SnoaL-like aldol condensation-catalyzing enzyme
MNEFHHSFERNVESHMTTTSPEENKALVLEAFDTLFNKRDYIAAERFWSNRYIQHSAHIPPGRDGLFNLVRALPGTLRYENHVILAEGDYVIAHGRFSGHGRPAAWIAADVVRFEDGKLAEHWDVLQDEATKAESLSGLPMFGDRFPTATAPAAQAELTVEAAKLIVGPLYDALNQPQKKDVAALLAQACHPDYKSYSTNEQWLTSDQLADAFKLLGASVPDLSWSIKDIWTSGDRIVVRGEATGTPVGELFGAAPSGRGFKTMAIDVFTVRGDKLASAYHVENWIGAIEQIR